MTTERAGADIGEEGWVDRVDHWEAGRAMDKWSGTSRASAPRILLTLLVGLLPHSRLKTLGLQKLCGWSIGKDCYIGPSVFLGMGEVRLEDGAGIGLGNVFRNIRKLHMGRRTMIHHFNWISADGSESRPECGCLVMGEQAAITGRHALDCSGGIIIESYGGIGGRGCTVITHQLDFVTNVMQHAPVRVGHHSAVNAHVLIAPGCTIAPCVVVGMGAVISQDLTEPYMLYAGVPAVAKKKIDGDWFRRGSSEHDANGSA